MNATCSVAYHLLMTERVVLEQGSSVSSRRREFKRYWPLYVMVAPAVVSIIVFSYVPYFGLSIAFMDFSIVRGYFASPWVGLKHFNDAFQNPFFSQAFRNTVIIKFGQTLVGFPSAVILALLINEVASKWYKRTVQTATMLPYFISWIVIAAMFRNIFTPEYGIVNQVLLHVFGRTDPFIVLSHPQRFRIFIILQDTWRFAGFFAVIYLASISAIDPTLYEVAEVDGASRWKQTRHITLPSIAPTMVTLFVMLIGYLVIGSFEQVFAQYNVAVYQTADILETLTFRLGIQQGRFSFATAIGLFQSVIAVFLVIGTNWFVRRVGQEGLF